MTILLDAGRLPVMAAWVEGRVAGKRQWTQDLFSLRSAAPDVKFVAGQFARLALPAPPGSDEPMIGRPYSFVNPPHEAAARVLLHRRARRTAVAAARRARAPAIRSGSRRAPTGSSSIGEVAPRRRAVVPRDRDRHRAVPVDAAHRRAVDEFQRVVLVHAVRHAEELTYRDVIADIARARAGAFTYVPMVSREPHPGALSGRIPAAIDDGRLEARAGAALSPENSHAMLCGNPAMVEDTQKVLAVRGMRRHRRKEPGHVTVETYW